MHAAFPCILQIPDGKVEFRSLTLRNPPPGPPGSLPYSLLRLPIWTVAFRRYLIGSKLENLLTLTDCMVELPPEEVALLMADAGVGPTKFPPSLAGLACAADMHTLFTTRKYNTVSRPVRVRVGRRWSIIISKLAVA